VGDQQMKQDLSLSPSVMETRGELPTSTFKIGLRETNVLYTRTYGKSERSTELANLMKSSTTGNHVTLGEWLTLVIQKTEI
jgi:hypothetical protein